MNLLEPVGAACDDPERHPDQRARARRLRASAPASACSASQSPVKRERRRRRPSDEPRSPSAEAQRNERADDGRPDPRHPEEEPGEPGDEIVEETREAVEQTRRRRSAPGRCVDPRATSGSCRDGPRASSTRAPAGQDSSNPSAPTTPGTRRSSRRRSPRPGRPSRATTDGVREQATGERRIGDGRHLAPFAGDRFQHGVAVDDADDAAVLRRRRSAGRWRRARGTASRTVVRHVELGAVGLLPGAGIAHDPAKCQHMAARDVADEVRDVVVGRRADELLAGARAGRSCRRA